MKRKQQAVWDKTNGHCWYCGKQLVIGSPSDPESKRIIAQWFVMDHVVPKTHGGSDHIHNLVPACWICNSTKGHKTFEQYRLYLSMRQVGMPYFTVEQIAWLQKQGFKVREVRPMKFWAENQGLDFEIYEKVTEE